MFIHIASRESHLRAATRHAAARLRRFVAAIAAVIVDRTLATRRAASSTTA